MGKDEIEQHIDRCIECHSGVAGTLDEPSAEPVDRSIHEIMRSDLMIAVGMLAALRAMWPTTTPQER